MADVSLQAVHRHYGAVQVVKDLHLAVASGEVMALLGASGCGKTTTLRMVAGLEAPSLGEIRVGGEVMAGPESFIPPERRRLGMVFQSYAVWPHLSVTENVAYPLRIQGVPAADRTRRVEEALEMVALRGLGSRWPSQLSGGQQQRVALARALVSRPRVLLLDEPLSNLDARLREEMRGEIRTLVKGLGMTVLLVTHDQEEAFAIADRVAVMRNGRIEQVDAPESLYRTPTTSFVARFIGDLNTIPGDRVEGGVSLPTGVILPCLPLTDSPSKGPACLGFRPEHVRLLPPREGVLAGTVHSVTFLGGRYRHRIHTEGAMVVADSPQALGEGHHVSLAITSAWVLPLLPTS